jgi:hypothetical protein
VAKPELFTKVFRYEDWQLTPFVRDTYSLQGVK